MVATRLRRPGEYLLIEDTSTISYLDRQAIPGLGPVDRQTDRQVGFLLHSVLAVAWPAAEPAGAEPRRWLARTQTLGCSGSGGGVPTGRGVRTSTC